MNIKSIYLVFFILLNFENLSAQASFRWGGLGYAHLGYGLGEGLTKVVGGSEAAGFSDLTWSPHQLNWGGGGFALFGRRYVVAGGGWGQFPQKANSGAYQARQSLGGGGLDLGYAFMNQNAWLGFAALGLGGYGRWLELENKSGQNLPFGQTGITGNGKGEFSQGLAYWQVRLDLHRFFALGTEPSGLSMGLSLGYLRGWGSQPIWSENGQDIGVLGNHLSMFFIRLQVGGGGFGF